MNNHTHSHTSLYPPYYRVHQHHRKLPIATHQILSGCETGKMRVELEQNKSDCILLTRQRHDTDQIIYSVILRFRNWFEPQ